MGVRDYYNKDEMQTYISIGSIVALIGLIITHSWGYALQLSFMVGVFLAIVRKYRCSLPFDATPIVVCTIGGMLLTFSYWLSWYFLYDSVAP